MGAAVLLLLMVGATPVAASNGASDAHLWMDGRTVSVSSVRELPIPSFSRQTKMACNACHTAFLQLTSFGRAFKLNGYTLSGVEKVTAQGAQGEGLSLSLIPPLSVMVQTSVTHVADTPEGTMNDQAEFPDQLSLFVGEAITPKLGTFLQFTYSGPDGSFGWDNADIRFADHGTLASKPLVYGVTVNNNPTVQDVWNSTPAWGWPFAGSSVAPSPVAATAVQGALAQRVVGLGAYAFWNGLIYAELTGYRSAPQGGPHPADASSEETLKGVSPYWRVAVSKDMGNQSLEVGTFGLSTREYPTGVSGLTNQYTDVALDAQYQRNFGSKNLTAHANFIYEHQALDAAFAAGAAASDRHILRSYKVDAQLVLSSGLVPGVGFLGTSGGSDSLLYPSDGVDGSATGRPNSNSFIVQLEYNPWLNTRIMAQYIAYTKFNGGGDNYNGAGRNASDNNALYLLLWLVF